MRLEIAVQVEGGAKTICAPPTAGNEIKRRRADSSDSLPPRLHSCVCVANAPIKVYYACKLQLVVPKPVLSSGLIRATAIVWFYAFSIRTTRRATMACHLTWAVIQSDSSSPPPSPQPGSHLYDVECGHKMCNSKVRGSINTLERVYFHNFPVYSSALRTKESLSFPLPSPLSSPPAAHAKHTYCKLYIVSCIC